MFPRADPGERAGGCRTGARYDAAMARASVRIEGAGRSELAVAGWVALGAVALVYAMLVVERQGLEHALHLAAPSEARPGSEIAIDAYVFDSAGASGSPELVRAEIEVELYAGARRVGGTTLSHGALDVAEGWLALPAEPGEHVLRARALVGGEVVATSRRPLRIASDATGAPELGRTAPLLMHFALGPVVVAAGALPPPRFEVLVQGGVCVPDEPCTLLLDLGAIGFDVELVPGPLVSLRGAPRLEGSTVAFGVAVGGPEGEADLVVRRDGVEVARRNVRLPVALATPWLGVDLERARAGVLDLEVVPPPGRSAVVVDVFSGTQWTRSVTLAAGSTDDLLGAPLAPGLYRVEARADPFRTERVTSRVVRVGDGGDALAGLPPGLSREGLAFELAAAELESVGLELPAATSGIDADRATLEGHKRLVRSVALGGMALAIVLLVVAVARRGVIANAQAGALLREAGADDTRAAQRRATLTLVLAVAGLAFALAASAALVMARSIVIGE